MKVIFFNGNLGNQVFYCAFHAYLENKFPQQKIYKYVTPYSPRVTVDKYFNLAMPQSNFFVNIVSFFVFVLDIFITKLSKKPIHNKIVCGRGRINENAIFYSNYLQDKKYYKGKDSNWLQVKMPDILSEKYLAFERMIKSTNSISVHIRRGDYISKGTAYVDLSSTDYYEKAIAKSKELFPDCHLFFFSDDLEFVKSKFTGDNVHYVDCNRGANSYLDIKLMSLAKVNIMANSSFSYWGAYMNNENKTIIYPKKWFREETKRDNPDIMLDNWIGM